MGCRFFIVGPQVWLSEVRISNTLLLRRNPPSNKDLIRVTMMKLNAIKISFFIIIVDPHDKQRFSIVLEQNKNNINISK